VLLLLELCRLHLLGRQLSLHLLRLQQRQVGRLLVFVALRLLLQLVQLVLLLQLRGRTPLQLALVVRR
jgi:hypothetical protein